MAKRQTVHIPPVVHRNPVPMAAKVGGLLCTSGIFGGDPDTGMLPESVADQAANAFRNLRNILEKAGGGPSDLAQLTIRIKDNAHREHLNGPWLEMFPDEDDRPARLTVVEPTLALQLQMDAIAFIDD